MSTLRFAALTFSKGPERARSGSGSEVRAGGAAERDFFCLNRFLLDFFCENYENCSFKLKFLY